MSLLPESWDMGAPGTPIAIARRDALTPTATSMPAERAVARALQVSPEAPRKVPVRAALEDLAQALGPQGRADEANAAPLERRRGARRETR